MKIAHFADTHLGLSQLAAIDPATGMNMRETLIYSNFLAAVEAIVREKPDVIIHAGDLFDQVKPKTAALTTVLDALTRLDEAGIPLVLISGNHSMPKTRYTRSPFTVLLYHHATVHAAYSYRYERVEIGDTLFHLIPNMLAPADYRHAFDKIACDGGFHNVLVSHGLASTLRDKRLRTVAELEIDATILSDAFDYIALGHYHGQVEVAANAWYSGSLEYLTYGEVRDLKGGLGIDLSRGEITHLPLPHTPMMDLGVLDCAGTHPRDFSARLADALATHAIPQGAMVRVRIAGLDGERVKQIRPRDLAPLREGLLDLSVRFLTPGDEPVMAERDDLIGIDYVEEFAAFVQRSNLKPADEAAVITRGRDAITRALQQRDEGIPDAP